MTTATKPLPPHHNNSTCVQWYKCQLPECRDRQNARRRALRAGTVQPSRVLVDAEPVRQHILNLQEAGLSPSCIGRLAGVPHTTIVAFLRPFPHRRRGRKRQTTPETAAKILAVRAFTVVGTLRRIQALVAVGWSARKVAAHAGVSTRWILDLRTATAITVSSAKKIAAAYEQLRHLDPQKNGVWAGHAKQSRERAKANRWPTPAYWAERMDVIDDPDFEPMYGVTRCEQIAQDAHWLITAGRLDRDQAAARLGVSRFSIDRALREHPQDRLTQAA